MSFELTEENFLMYAIKHYDNPNCNGMTEFLDDLKRFKYLKRLFRKNAAGKELRERLILNHIIVDAATKMLFFKIEKKFWSQLKTFLVFLNFMPIKIIVSKNIEIIESDIPLDNTIVNTLRKL